MFQHYVIESLNFRWSKSNWWLQPKETTTMQMAEEACKTFLPKSGIMFPLPRKLQHTKNATPTPPCLCGDYDVYHQ